MARARRQTAGFTLLELLTVMVVIGILVCLLIPSFAAFRSRADRASCVSNLQGLYAAANAYVQEHQQWPQISTKDLRSPVYINGWVNALQPYGLDKKNLVCPSVQSQLQNPDLSNPENARIDYLATPFDSRERAPYLYPSQPWFVERGDVHGDGNLVILTSGQVASLQELAKQASYGKQAAPY